jgi:hypothetical protein
MGPSRAGSATKGRHAAEAGRDQQGAAVFLTNDTCLNTFPGLAVAALT